MKVKRTYMSDKALIEGIRRNEPESYEALYRLNREGINNHIVMNSGTYDEFVEIHQETVILIVEKIKMGNLELTASLSTFKFSVAKNKWLKALRGKSKLTALTSEHDYEDFDYDFEKHQSKIRSVMKIFRSLDTNCQELLRMRFWGNEKLENIAELLGKNISAIKMQSKRCIDKLYVKYIYNKNDDY